MELKWRTVLNNIPDEIKPKEITVPDSPEYECFVTWVKQNYKVKSCVIKDGTVYIELED